MTAPARRLSALGEAALEYARRGVRVFPLVPRDKTPLTEHGHKDATVDDSRIREWWTGRPDANIGAPTGANGWAVVDVDSDSPTQISEIARQLGITAEAPMSRTGKGRQVFYKAVPGLRPAVRVAGLKVDVRSGESYVVLPPSRHPNGRTYTWQVPLCDPLPEIPNVTLKKLKPARKPPATVGPGGAVIREGERNDELARIGGRLRRVGATEVAILAQLKEANAARCRPPLPDAELEAIARSVARYEPGPAREPAAGAPEPPSADVVAEAGSMDRQAVLARIGKVLKTRDPTGPLTILLWAAQSHVVELMESVFYLAFRGRTGSGKGTGVELGVLLTPDGEVLGSVTEAYLASVLDEGKAIGIEEADELTKKNPAIETLLRNGYRRGVYYGFMVPSADKKWEKAKRSLFGPKVFDFHTSVDTHLLGRTIVVEMEPDDSVDRAMDAEKKARRILPVRLWLAAEAARAKERWTKEKADALWDDPGFRKRVERMGGSTGRDHVIAALMLLTCEVFGWNYEDDVRKVLADRKTLDEWGEEAEVLDVIRGLFRDGKPDDELTTEFILEVVNEARTRLRLRPMTPKGLAGVLKDLGLKRGTDLLRAKAGPNRDKNVILPYKLLYTESAQPAQPAQKNDPLSIWSGGAKSGPDEPVGQGICKDEGGDGQDPDFMAGLEHSLECQRYDPKRPAEYRVQDTLKKMRGWGLEPDAARVRAGVERGMKGASP